MLCGSSFWRSERDLNSRVLLHTYSLSRGAPSASWVSLRIKERYRRKMAERVGFEPTAHCCVTGFQDRLLKPLGHLSELRSNFNTGFSFCQLLCAEKIPIPAGLCRRSSESALRRPAPARVPRAGSRSDSTKKQADPSCKAAQFRAR